MRRLSREPTRLQRIVHTLRTEGASRSREAWAVGLGVFVGCSPLIGLHLALCIVVGWLFDLNRLKLYLAANLVNPLILPAILFAEVQVGAWLLRGRFYPLSREAIAALNPWHFGADLAIGSLVVGGLIGAGAGGVTYALLGRAYKDPEFTGLVGATADRYLGTSVTAWEFGRAKLRNDPVYRAIVCGGWLPASGRLLDVGCGQGLLLALLAEARRAAARGTWPSAWPAPPDLELMGLELRPRMAALARHALGGEAEIAAADARRSSLGAADVITVLDVLHLLDAAAQRDIVNRAAAALRPGGLLIIREADASAGWRFQMVRFGNRVTAIVQGRWRAQFCFRTADEWRAFLAVAGLSVTTRPMGEGTPFANVLLVARKSGTGVGTGLTPVPNRRRTP